jgi:hypothetical protein
MFVINSYNKFAVAVDNRENPVTQNSDLTSGWRSTGSVPRRDKDISIPKQVQAAVGPIRFPVQ